jgi:hypothetical protein
MDFSSVATVRLAFLADMFFGLLSFLTSLFSKVTQWTIVGVLACVHAAAEFW